MNSNYKSKNAVPQGTELEAGMQTKRKKAGMFFGKTEVLFTTLFAKTSFCRMQCGTDEPDKKSVDLDYTIAAEADIPRNCKMILRRKRPQILK